MLLLITVLGFWRPYFHDAKPVQRWVWIIPVIFIVCIAAGINYSGLADHGTKFTLMLIAAAVLVGFNEEGMFRCIGVTAFRQHGFTEGKVAFWTSLIFGLAHVANLIGGNARAFVQAAAVSFAGYFFYLIRRVSRSNVLNTVLHGGFDFMIISGTQTIPEGEQAHPGAALSNPRLHCKRRPCPDASPQDRTPRTSRTHHLTDADLGLGRRVAARTVYSEAGVGDEIRAGQRQRAALNRSSTVSGWSPG